MHLVRLDLPGLDLDRLELAWLDPADPERHGIDGAVAVLEAARVLDCPHEIPSIPDAYRAYLRHGWDGEPPEAAVLCDPTGRVVAVLEVSLPRRDNTHLAYVEITVDPVLRRRGIGRLLFDQAVHRARAEGRELLVAESFDEAPGGDFCTALGLERASTDVKRRQDLRCLDWSALDALHAAAEGAATGYELVRMPREIPDELMPAVVTMVSAINDAPLDDLQLEDEVFTPERIRAFHLAQVARGRRIYQLAARDRASGALAGHTVVAVEGYLPAYAHQFDTSVLAEHRGHRLGVLLKAAMLRWLGEAEPQLRVIDTWNAASNSHMVAVNEALGYQVIATSTAHQRHLAQK